MPTTITSLTTHDIRFPTAVSRAGSDAMNPDPDYSAAYVVLGTDHPDGLEGHGLTFTIGRGNEVCVAAIEAYRPLVVGRTLESLAADMGAFWSSLAGESQLRWTGPEKGVIHLALAAVVNAAWDLVAKAEKKPLWKLLVDMTPEQLVACIPFRHITDAVTPDDALRIFRELEASRGEREAIVRRDGYPAYTTSAGWIGYSDEQLRALLRDGVDRGWTHFKMKVGRDLHEDLRRASIIREEIGWDRTLMMDANQVWDVPEAIRCMRELARFRPLWIEEPTSPDDILGHRAIADAVRPIGVATGEHCHNRIMFKQFLQAGAIDFCQIDSCRLGGVNEVIAVLVLAKTFGVPVCPHAGGVGLCEYVQHLSIFDFVAVSGTMDGRVLEYVDHLHEHFVDPVVMRGDRYTVPTAPGYSIEMKAESMRQFSYPDGPAWRV